MFVINRVLQGGVSGWMSYHYDQYLRYPRRSWCGTLALAGNLAGLAGSEVPICANVS